MNTIEIRQTLFDLAKCGKVKTKGRYEVMPFDKIGWQKNHSCMVVPTAVLAHTLGMCDYEEYIRLHKDKFDFMLRTKVPRSSRLVLVTDDGELPLQNICRYYPSKKGGKLVKIMPPLIEGGEWRRLGIDTDWVVTPCNNVNDFSWGVDYDYYLQQAEQLIRDISVDVTN